MDDGDSPLWGCIAFLIFLILNGVMHAFSVALDNLSQSELEDMTAEDDPRRSDILRIMDDPDRVMNTVHIAALICSIVLAVIGVRFFVQYVLLIVKNGVYTGSILSMAAVGVVGVAIFAVIIVVLASVGIFVPQIIARRMPEKTVIRLYGIVSVVMTLIFPVTWLTTVLSHRIVRILGLDPNKKEDVTEEEIISMVDEAHEQGVILESEAEMIQNIMQYSDKNARDIMTHRNNITAVDQEQTLKDTMNMMLGESNSRYPVYSENIDNIIGIMFLKDVMKQYITYPESASKRVCDIVNLIRNVAFIPETRGIDDILHSMQARKMHMMIVVDEYGQTSGLVTMEDILEEIVGNIQDEYDDEEVLIQPQYDNSIIMDGLTPLDQVSEVLEVGFKDEDFETLNGYLTSLLDHIPTGEDKEVSGYGYRFQILSVESNIIQKVRVEKLEKEND